MDNENIKPTIEDKLQERLLALPKAVQEAISSSDVEKHLRELSEVHKLHLDQWQKLENEVMLTLLGLEEAENLEENLKKEVGVPDDIAAALTADIARIVFQPIRAELEKELPAESYPLSENEKTDAPQAEAVSAAPTKSEQPAPEEKDFKANEPVEQKLLPAPSTPPQKPPAEKAVRASISSSYTATPSHGRKDVENDPYREPIN